ncbi:MAG: HDOD domain-containing protein [Candidatus Neomarinimicrobiota bacterium]|nr:MAG: HDOD domain-containing protein [Candidatus Neomarinimicrobiota bacterium]
MIFNNVTILMPDKENSKKMETFVARQPIFDKQENIFAYELLYRESRENAYSMSDADAATSKVIVDSFLMLGVDNLTGGNPAFINMTYNLLLEEYVSLLPKENVFVEILENVEPDEHVVDVCRKLKSDGYTIVLDDFEFEEKYLPLIELADIIKVDFRLSPEEEQAAIVKRFPQRNIRFLAEKVETREEFKRALEMGYTLFQGYFFGKPHIISGQGIPPQLNHYIRLLHEINKPEPNFKNIETIIKKDLSLSYKLLRYINSAFFGLRQKVNSILHALTLLGVMEIRKWSSLVFIANMSKNVPEELVVQSVIRARFAESLANPIGQPKRRDDLFLMGLFSLIDAIVNQPMETVLEKIPIQDDVKAAIMDRSGTLGTVLNCVTAYERGEWDQVTQYCQELSIDESQLPVHYINALKWADQSIRNKVIADAE